MGQRERCQFFARLGALLDSGIELERALAVMKDKAGGAFEKEIVGHVLSRIKQGLSLSEALADSEDYFTKLDARMAASGEAGGRLPQALINLAAILERAHKYRLKMKADNIYYTVMIVLAVGLLIFIKVIYTIPAAAISDTFMDMYVRYPGNQRDLGYILQVLDVVTLTLAILIAGAPLVFLVIHLRAPEVWSKLIFYFPWLNRRAMTADYAAFARSMELAVESGIPLPESVELAAGAVENLELEYRLLALKQQLKQGQSLGSLLATVRGIPRPMRDMVALAEDRGGIAEAFAEVADLYENEQETKGNPWLILVPASLIVIIFINIIVANYIFYLS